MSNALKRYSNIIKTVEVALFNNFMMQNFFKHIAHEIKIF